MADDARLVRAQDRLRNYLRNKDPSEFDVFPESLRLELVRTASRRSRRRVRFSCPVLCGCVQSTEIPVGGPDSTSTVVSAENIVFHDAAVSDSVKMGSFAGDYDQDDDSAASLGEYLKRPVRIGNFAWAQGGGFAQSLTPWSAYFSDTYIRRKLENYGKIRCRLHLKFMVNASPFHYGSVRACYFPMGDARSTFVNTADLIPFSQTPGVYIEPQNMTSAEMVLPFVWQHNWLETTKLTDFQRIGKLNLTEYAPLQSANGATSGCSILVYAWAEDVELMGPTTIGSLQSDEYAVDQGVISGPATAIANVANMVSNVPVIGDFARATEMGARAVGGIAKLFGYSNPPMIDDVAPMQPKAFHAFANVETRVPIDKLCLDPKNEVSISPAIAGVEEEDPLVITNLTTRESYINGFTWSGAQSTDTLLWSAVVNPHYAYLSGGFRTMPPVTYLSPNFRFWRGSIVYKFRFIKTPFHKGRVLISYDPNGDITGTVDTETTTFSRVVDLEQETEVEFAVPYKATSPMLEIVPMTTWPNTNSTSTTPGYTYNSRYYNGVITMRIQTTLTGPTTTTNVGVLTYVKTGEDFEFAAPAQIPRDVQLRDADGVIQSEEVITRDVLSKQDKLALITTGETICSLRPLLHRTHHVCTQLVGDGMYGVRLVTARNVYYPIPHGTGRTSQSAQTGYGQAEVAKYGYNWNSNNPLDWVCDMFVGVRGSTTFHANIISGTTNVRVINSLSAARWYGPLPGLNGNVNGQAYADPINPGLINAVSREALYGAPPTGAGLTLTNCETQSALSCNVPQYLPYRFTLAFHTQRGLDRRTGLLHHDNISVRTVFQPTQAVGADPMNYPLIEVYQSAGVDFTPIMFLCTPRVFSYVLPTASVP